MAVGMAHVDRALRAGGAVGEMRPCAAPVPTSGPAQPAGPGMLLPRGDTPPLLARGSDTTETLHVRVSCGWCEYRGLKHFTKTEMRLNPKR